ncbi:conserved hypothetical protein [Capnocytophaga canimorsus]|uniref:Winged helix DNA-binding domain-containing protein n=2 Tax=Capnocytophaga canimorsus TaxID=28188 RepID=A0A0B7HJ35_9FLAO|nr:conserved hypothetical protein [Capnocytophaga canimorsus]
MISEFGKKNRFVSDNQFTSNYHSRRKQRNKNRINQVMFKNLNPLLHSQLRLAIMSLLVSEEKADFNRIKEVTQATSGNISVQIAKLEKAGYITVTKSFKDNYPNTELALTSQGLEAFEEYVEALKGYLNR